jgi:hypothetical protein
MTLERSIRRNPRRGGWTILAAIPLVTTLFACAPAESPATARQDIVVDPDTSQWIDTQGSFVDPGMIDWIDIGHGIDVKPDVTTWLHTPVRPGAGEGWWIDDRNIAEHAGVDVVGILDDRNVAEHVGLDVTGVLDDRNVAEHVGIDVSGMFDTREGLIEHVGGDVVGLIHQNVRERVGGDVIGMFDAREGVVEHVGGGVSGMFDTREGVVEHIGGGAIGMFDTREGVIEHVGGSVAAMLSPGTPVCRDTSGRPSCPGDPVWARSYGGWGDQVSRAIAMSPDGEIAMGGYFLGSLDFGAGPLLTLNADAFVARLDRDGMPLWEKRLGGTGLAEVERVAMDRDGSVIAAGAFRGDLYTGLEPNVRSHGNSWDVFVVKYDADGEILWAKTFGDGATQRVTDLGIGPKGEIVLTGWLQGSINFGAGDAVNASREGYHGAFVAKLDRNGNGLWSHAYGGWGGVDATSLAVDAEGNVAVAGYFDGAVDLGDGSHATQGGDDAFVMSLDREGAVRWVKTYGGPTMERASSIAVDPYGNLLLAGTFDRAIDFGSGTLVSHGYSDLFVTKLTSTGKSVWARSFGDMRPNGYLSLQVATDARGDAVLGGIFDGMLDFGVARLEGRGQWSFFVAKLDLNGHVRWADRFGNGDTQMTHGLAVNERGEVAVSGEYKGTMAIGADWLKSRGGFDIFLAKLAP